MQPGGGGGGGGGFDDDDYLPRPWASVEVLEADGATWRTASTLVHKVRFMIVPPMIVLFVPVRFMFVPPVFVLCTSLLMSMESLPVRITSDDVLFAPAQEKLHCSVIHPNPKLTICALAVKLLLENVRYL